MLSANKKAIQTATAYHFNFFLISNILCAIEASERNIIIFKAIYTFCIELRTSKECLLCFTFHSLTDFDDGGRYLFGGRMKDEIEEILIRKWNEVL